MIINGQRLLLAAPISLPTASYLHERLDCDYSTGKLFWKSHGKSPQWDARWAGREAFTTIGKNGYAFGRLDWRGYLAHRIIWTMHTGEWPDQQIDHINGIRADNRVVNLRSVSQVQNSQNSAIPSHNTSGHIGVSWAAKPGLWEAHIGLRVPEYKTKGGNLRRSKKKFLGHFRSLQDAVDARAEASRLYGFSDRHGEKSGLPNDC